MHKLSILALEENNFGGELPASIFNLTYLTSLALRSNMLRGPLPDNVSGLSWLFELFLFDNHLEGRVPSWLLSLPSLLYFDLSDNRLTGPIDHIEEPSLILGQVYLSHNEISGSIPNSFFDLVSLFIVDISSNNLSGSITPNMLSKHVKLEYLDLSNNRLISLSNNGTGANHTFPSLSALIFSSCNIHKFPSFLMKATRLIILDISNNKISGHIHKWEIEGMSSLNILNLSYNSLAGIELFAFKSLTDVDLSSNFLQGSFPILSTTWNLEAFFISGNNLTGEIPSSLCNFTSLMVLDLANNSLEGKIPECLVNFSHLSILDLRFNKFHGRIPNLFVNHSWLRTLNLNGNRLEGRLPSSLANCSWLTVLDVGNNYLNDRFPHWLGVLPSLQILILRSNRFHGAISNSMPAFYFSQLRIIDISQNDFMGLLPSSYFKNLKAMSNIHQDKVKLEYIGERGYIRGDSYNYDYYEDSVMLIIKGSEVELGRILTIFTTIDFSGNQFQGHIPEELGELNSLVLLNFSHNNLTGQIPSSLAKITELESLDLSSNKLDGRIPEQLTNLTFLSVLNLSYNNLVGHIPKGKQFDTFSNDSYIGNSGLCGLPLTKKCSEGSESPPSKFEDDSAALFDWKVALMGYGSGLVLGFSVGYIVFTTGKPWWLVKKVELYQQKFVARCNCRQKKRRNQQPNRRS